MGEVTLTEGFFGFSIWENHQLFYGSNGGTPEQISRTTAFDGDLGAQGGWADVNGIIVDDTPVFDSSVMLFIARGLYSVAGRKRSFFPKEIEGAYFSDFF